MRYREKANKLANEVANLANGSLQSFALEGAVHRIEEALDKAREDAIRECSKRINKAGSYGAAALLILELIEEEL